ncbi:flagella synthesis protein FlgN [Solimonas flava]|uniref:flagella synthesis protein FlgN n=1 Tax=Solimonas flava TaxID=415849 RepID=UPI00040CD69B|nr:flagellar protein FlgN [Solimonas flava]
MSESLAQQLRGNLEAQRDCAQRLLGLLQEERTALIASDVERLETITRTKAEAAGLMQTLGQALQQLRGAASIERLLASLREHAPAALWRELLGLAAQCQRANDDNAVLLGTREAQLKQTLRAFRPPESPELYGRSGYAALGLPARDFGSA